jgi:hypothetical protein
MTPKLLTRTADGSYWFVEPTRESLIDVITEPAQRVPGLAFAVALYGGSAYFRQWGDRASEDRLFLDLMLPRDLFDVMFDFDEALPLNAALLRGNLLHVGPANPPERARRVADPREVYPRRAPATTRYRSRAPIEFRRQAAKEADPNVRLELLERATNGHRRALDALATSLAQWEPREQDRGYDLAIAKSGAHYIFEVKTWRVESLVARVRFAVGQLYEYRWVNRDELHDAKLVLVLDRKPPPGFDWLWRYLVEDRDITPAWIDEGRVATFPRLASRLP